MFESHINTHTTFLYLNLFISNDIISTNIHTKRNDTDFDIINFMCVFYLFIYLFDGAVPLRHQIVSITDSFR